MELIPTAFMESVVFSVSTNLSYALCRLPASSNWNQTACRLSHEKRNSVDMEIQWCGDHGYVYQLRRSVFPSQRVDIKSWISRADVLGKIDYSYGMEGICHCSLYKWYAITDEFTERLATIILWNRRRLERVRLFTSEPFDQEHMAFFEKLGSIIPAVEEVIIGKDCVIVPPTLVTKGTDRLDILEVEQELPEEAHAAVLQKIQNGTLRHLRAPISTKSAYRTFLRTIADSDITGTMYYSHNMVHGVENNKRLQERWKLREEKNPSSIFYFSC